MKKINSLIICIMIFFSSFSFSIINAENIDKYNLIAENVIQKVETMENQEIELIDTKILLDIEHNPNYLLIL